MSDGPRLSIVIPTLNEGDTIAPLLHDLRGCYRPGDEIIVVDGGSTDHTTDKVRRHADRVLTSAPGRARQMNLGAESANGDAIWFLHADTRLPPRARDDLAALIGRGVAWGRFDIRLSGARWRFRLIESLINLRSRLSGIATGDQGMFVRRELFHQVGGFPEIPLMEDVALSRSLKRRRRPHCVRHPRIITSSRRWEDRGTIRTILLMWRLRLAYALGASADRLARHYR